MLLMPGADIGQLSPDGMFRWDGTAWRPTAEPYVPAPLILLGFSASFAWRGSLADIGVAELAARAVHAALNGLSGSAFVARPLIQARTRLATAAPIARGLLIATPIALVLGLLLAAADPVFASFFQLNVDLGQLTLDAFFVIAGSV